MKKSILSTLLMLISFTISSQTSVKDSTYKPVFYGVMSGDTTYCFGKQTTRQIAKDITTAKGCDTTISLMHKEKALTDTLIQKMVKTIYDQGKVLENDSKIIAAYDANTKIYKEKVNALEKKVLKLQKAGNFLKGGLIFLGSLIIAQTILVH